MESKLPERARGPPQRGVHGSKYGITAAWFTVNQHWNSPNFAGGPAEFDIYGSYFEPVPQPVPAPD